MDPMLLRIYQQQVEYCCRAVLFGLEDIQSVGAADNGRLWYGAQNLITGAGNASKTLWGIGNSTQRKRRYAERKPLRDSLSVDDDSPLRDIKIRNDYEHLDERIERWWDESPNRNFIGAMIGPRGAVGGDSITEIDTLRWLDPESGDVIFWGNQLHIPAVVREAQRILSIADAESRKPHREAPSTSGGGQ